MHHILVQGPFSFYCSVLLTLKCMFMQILAVFYYENRSEQFFIFQKWLTFTNKKIVFLVVGHLKNMNPESIDLCYGK